MTVSLIDQWFCHSTDNRERSIEDRSFDKSLGVVSLFPGNYLSMNLTMAQAKREASRGQTDGLFGTRVWQYRNDIPQVFPSFYPTRSIHQKESSMFPDSNLRDESF